MSKSAIYEEFNGEMCYDHPADISFQNILESRRNADVIGHTVECDSCRRKEQHMFKSYTIINKKLKEDGWIVTIFDGIWVDFCSQECRNSYTKNVRKKIGYK
ncbi:MAG: hypothetical protein M0Q88_00145 [Bacilli bacterium]|nr:hypothetical protein [Bacilli bacterium]